MKMKVKRSMAVLLSGIVILLGSFNNVMGKELDNNQNASNQNTKMVTNVELQKFSDEFFKKNMDKYSVPGAAIAVVKDGKEVFKKGYGYSNVEEKLTVDPDKTLFPAASVSKLFTATAIMQLHEQGKIDLNANIDNYIKPYKVSNNYKEAVTCSNLLTHSSGVDEASELNGGTTDTKSIKPQEYYMDNHIPKVVRQPNTVSIYCNEGFNLLGYIVEKVSGMTYEEYLKKNILDPLKMNSSLIRLKNANTAKGYEFVDGKYNEIPLAYQYTSGSSGIIASVKNMENFMLAHLSNGEFEDKKILKEETSMQMKNKQFSNSSGLPGMGYGFIRSNRNGEEIIKHEGGLPSGYTTTMFLMPKEKLGIYVATNSLSPLPFNFEEEFLNYFYPSSNDGFNKINKNSAKDYSKYEGTYRSYDGIAKSNIMKIAVLFDPTVDMEIKDNKDGSLTLKEYTPAKEKITTTLIEKEEGVFARQDGRGDFAFKVNDNGKVIYAFNDLSQNSYERISFYEEGSTNIAIFIIIMVMFVINIFGTIVLFIRNKFKRKDNKSCKSIKVIRLVNFIIALLNIVGIAGAVLMAMIMINLNDFTYAYLLYTFLSMLIISTILSVCGFICLIYTWIKCNGTRIQRILLTMINIANIIFIWFIHYFNLLGFKI